MQEKAAKMVVEDIKKTDKELYTQLQAQGGGTTSVEKINSAVTKDLLKTAPQDPTKPFKGDLDDLGGDVYEKYYKF
jgi:hypothetical protein